MAGDPGPADAKPLLRVMTCGSVDDGKSTLIGRLLHDGDALPSDLVEALRAGHGPIDFAALLDGLSAEKEQGITIDVAYRYFETARRSFIIADAPGHRQYTRNMVTAASQADAAVVLVDARHGIVNQTRRHSCILSLMGVRSVILAVNKMDAVGHDAAVFEAVRSGYADLAERLGLEVRAVPISALAGDNLFARSERMGWYDGPTLIEHLHAVPPASRDAAGQPFAMPVQMVTRHDGFRGYAGRIASGRVAAGDDLVILPSRQPARVERLVGMTGDPIVAAAGDSAMIVLDGKVDCSRGHVLAARDTALVVADQFEATLVWLADDPMVPGRRYRLKIGTSLVEGWVTTLKSELDVDTLDRLAVRRLDADAIGTANLAIDRPMPLAPYADNRDLGGFILIDRESEATVGAGLVNHVLSRAANVQWQDYDVTREARAAAKHQIARLVWLTGLSGAGKTTIANAVDRRLHALGKHSFVLDGDNVRHGLSKDLGFTEEDRVENIRRVGEAARLMTDAGLIVIASLISPYRTDRDMVRGLFAPGEFVEVFVDTPIEVAEARDPKGLYAKARQGLLRNFTGVDSPYEAPETPDLRIATTDMSVDAAADAIVALLLGPSPRPDRTENGAAGED